MTSLDATLRVSFDTLNFGAGSHASVEFGHVLFRSGRTNGAKDASAARQPFIRPIRCAASFTVDPLFVLSAPIRINQFGYTGGSGVAASNRAICAFVSVKSAAARLSSNW